MTTTPPPADTSISADLVQALVNEHAPHLRGEEIVFHSSGWDNEIHRVGDSFALRLPRRTQAAALVTNEQTWLPELADTLPLPIPVPTIAGQPSLGYPHSWSLVPWLPGVTLGHAPALRQDTLIDDLASFLNALHLPAPDEAPANPHRGGPLPERSDRIREWTACCAELIDEERTLTVWDELVDTPAWGGPAIWLHGDLHPLNLLVRGGRLSAVIDWGDITSGDPATDLGVAWMLFDEEGRDEFRRALRVDGQTIDIHTWNRARAWALSFALAVLAHSDGAPTLRRIGLATHAQAVGR